MRQSLPPVGQTDVSMFGISGSYHVYPVKFRTKRIVVEFFTNRFYCLTHVVKHTVSVFMCQILTVNFFADSFEKFGIQISIFDTKRIKNSLKLNIQLLK